MAAVRYHPSSLTVTACCRVVKYTREKLQAEAGAARKTAMDRLAREATRHCKQVQCVVCQEEHHDIRGITCSLGLHLTCTECFAGNVQACCAANADSGTAAARVACVCKPVPAGGCASRDFRDLVCHCISHSCLPCLHKVKSQLWSSLVVYACAVHSMSMLLCGSFAH